MIVRPAPASVGLDDQQLEVIKGRDINRTILRERLASYGTAVIGLCIALWVMFPLKTEELLLRLGTMALLTIFGWPFVWNALYGLTGLFLLRPSGYQKVEAYHQAMLDFERKWREQYWKSFWDSFGLLAYHVERLNDYPQSRIGFLEHWRILPVTLFFVLKRKRHILYFVPDKQAQFEEDAARKALDTKTFYSADVMCLLSPKGFSQKTVEYLARDHARDFLFQIGQEATDLIEWLKQCELKAPAVPLDVIGAANDFKKLLREWQEKENGLHL